MGCCESSCSTSCECDCHRFTSPGRAGRAGLRLSRLWDRARDLYSRAGLRPYAVAIVRVRYAGGARRGDGPQEVIGEWPILPTPKIGDLTGMQEIVDVDQLREVGTVLISEISLRYTEDVLLGRGDGGAPVSASEAVYFEVRFLDGTGRVTQRRRFTAASPPFADMARAQWMISVSRAYSDRERAGAPR